MDLSSSTAAWIAIGAGAAAVIALALVAVGLRDLRRLRAAQTVVLGGDPSGSQDLVDFAVSLQARIDDLDSSIHEIAAAVARVDRRVDRSLSRAAVIRYDAYEHAGGHQSASVALLDASRTGVVMTAIQGRDYARVYVKELEHGQTSIALSPEEQEAVERAMGARA
jgi:hypothetical protein